eukprot:760464-Amphidinium_carterae.1
MLGGGARTDTITRISISVNRGKRQPGPGPWHQLGLHTLDRTMSRTMHVHWKGPPRLCDFLGNTDSVDPRFADD